MRHQPIAPESAVVKDDVLLAGYHWKLKIDLCQNRLWSQVMHTMTFPYCMAAIFAPNVEELKRAQTDIGCTWYQTGAKNGVEFL